jgi:cellulose synthase/poly-beta-1,6-N-acetylglucosamine synthase-like glycosyltransferase
VDIIRNINAAIGVLFFVCYFYQMIYLIVPFFEKKKERGTAAFHRYAVLVAARNEEEVIGQLIESIRSQSYPMEWVEIFVVADNCTDDTAQVARMAGAHVYERFNRIQVGKGYALEYLLKVIQQEWGWDSFEGYFVFDADNLLDEHYIEEMNREISRGYQAMTSCRNSKNYDDNWISAGYSLWFMRDSEFMNRSRNQLGISSVIAGTGFYISTEIVKRYGGWKWFLMTEDTELTVRLILDGIRIGYCSEAVFYDEQPTTFSQSWHQRKRWAKGFLQVFSRDGLSLIKGMFGRQGASCYDMVMSIMPAIALSMVSLTLNVAAAFVGGLTGANLQALFLSVLQAMANTYLLMLGIGAVTLFARWKQIYGKAYKKVGYLFLFPVFMMTYIPIAASAIFGGKVEWKPIKHTRVKNLSEVRN